MPVSSPWNWDQIVVNDKGQATPEFLAWLRNQLTISKLVGEAVPSGRQILTGLGLTGGGDLTADRIISLAAEIDDLLDVDTVTTPPIAGDALVWDNVNGLWVPGAVGGSIDVQQDGVLVASGVTVLNFISPMTAIDMGSGIVDIYSTPPIIIGSHRYWRVKCTATQGFYGFSEVQMRSTVGGEDIGPSGTAISSSNYGGGFIPAYAFNGSNQNFWAASGGTGQWVGVDFGTAQSVAEIAFNNLNIGNNPGAWDVDYSDDNVTWTTAWSGVLGSDSATKFWVSSPGSTSVSYPFSTVKYRFYATATPSGGYTSFAEARLLNTAGYPMFPAQISQSSNFGGYGGVNAFDFNTSTNWISSSPSNNEWISFDSTRETVISAGSFYGIASSVGGEGSRAPTSFNVESSIDNGASWQLVTAFTSIGAWTDGQTRTLSL